MTSPAIRTEGLGKRYRLGEREPYKSLRETIVRGARNLLRFRGPEKTREKVWALCDFSVEIEAGEVVGVIGRNGAGKTTFLKILSRITRPTEGRAEILGRVGSLLEVGTGFHPELTGRENIYLNGAILGMKRAEIQRSFDSIVEFAEIEQFIDTPVKRYSSGMYLRLAFSVAAHLLPDVLLVDEVLAVGDLEFQKKCMSRMGRAGDDGRTVLLVSHNLTAIQSLSHRVIWIEGGRLRAFGSPGEVVSAYLESVSSEVDCVEWPTPVEAPGSDKVRLKSARVVVRSDDGGNLLTMTTPLAIEFEYWTMVDGLNLNLSLHLINSQGITVFNTTSRTDPHWHGRPFPKGLFKSICEIPPALLNQGFYHVDLMAVADAGKVLWTLRDLVTFNVLDAPELRSGWYGRRAGVVHPVLPWVTELTSRGE